MFDVGYATSSTNRCVRMMWHVTNGDQGEHGLILGPVSDRAQAGWCGPPRRVAVVEYGPNHACARPGVLDVHHTISAAAHAAHYRLLAG